MNEKTANPFDFSSQIDTWMQSMGNFWSEMQNQSTTQTSEANSNQQENQTSHKTRDTIAAAIKNWQAFLQTLSTPESMQAFIKSSGTMPEMVAQLSKSSMDNIMDYHQRLLQHFSRLGESVEAYQFQDMDGNPNQMWNDVYESEFRQFFQLPQLGLMRQYQERLNQAVDKYHLFQSKLSEYLNLLSIPVTRSAGVMQEKLSEMMENGELPDDTHVYYNLWIKVLEGHFMTLFQTPEYAETQALTLNALADFSTARDAVLEDVLQLLPVAKQTDLDDMARELYELKKRVNQLEKILHQTVDQ
ncbi:PhaE: putative poly(3-hydroxyalkanoate) synthase component [Desulfosarcina variabilis str. Montpellier]|uniref:poly(R)-hydroxyalkanoic acid synthase subunit PhaE n=1 Tax=Desulfosarcina variabilis TaxID=2300 RepID=UPI003AFA7C14